MQPDLFGGFAVVKAWGHWGLRADVLHALSVIT
jgi:hypothetical protein